MVALGTDSAQKLPHEGDLRRGIGVGLTVAWVLVHLWHASPLPYALEQATGLVLRSSASQERGLLVGFALCLAILLFRPRYVKMPGWVDGVLAAVALVAGSSVFWNYENINANVSNPDGLSLAVAAIGLTMPAGAATRVFGGFGVALLAFVTAMHLLPLIVGYWRLYHLKNPVNFLHHHWHTSESVFGLMLGLVLAPGFFFVMLGVGLDVLGLGRPIARWALQPLRSKADVGRLAADHRLAPRLWALAIVFYLVLPGLPFGSEYVWLLEWLVPVSVGLLVYAVSLAIGALALGTEVAASHRRLPIVAGGMLVAAALALDAAMKFAAVVIAVAFSEMSLGLPRLATPVAWLLIFSVVSVMLVALGNRRSLAAAAFLPVLLFFWLAEVESFSPSLSGLFAVLLLLLVMIEYCFSAAATEGNSLAEIPSLYLRRAVLPLCYGQARVMVRVVILVALLGMLLPWSLDVVPYWVSEAR